MTSTISELLLNTVRLDGCAVGLLSTKGTPIKKPWMVATSLPKLFERFEPLRCQNNNEHCPCAGGETNRTEWRTDTMVKLIHRAVDDEARDRGAGISIAVREKVAEDDRIEAQLNEYGGPDEESKFSPDGHRPEIMEAPLWCSMVMKTLSPKGPMRHNPRAKAAIQKEFADLRNVPAWDKVNVMETTRTRIAPVFAILGIRH